MATGLSTKLTGQIGEHLVTAELGRMGLMSTLQRAIEIAVEAHKGQTDKAGLPYVLHPILFLLW